MPPGLRLLPRYRRQYLPGDLGAGFLVAALAVPQALGYATVAGVPVQVGLYTLPPALLAYALFGSSRLLFVGPVSTVSVLSGSIVRGLSGGDPVLATQLTAALAVVAGIVLVAAGLLRIGWVAQFLSEPIVAGFVAGLVALIVVGEVPGLAGLDVPQGSLTERIWELASHLHQAHAITLCVGLGALVMLFVGSALAPRLPWSLLTLLAGIGVSAWLGLADRGVHVIGALPTGWPLPTVPDLPISQWTGLITGGLAVAAVAIAEGLAAGRAFTVTRSSGREPRVHDNDELIGHGVANLASGVCGGMGVGGSLSKTAANARAGAHTQLSGVFAAVVVLVFVFAATGLLRELPRAVLSAIVIHAVWGLVRPSDFRDYARVRRNDFVGSMVAFFGVLALGPLGGLLVAVAQSLLGLVYRSMQVNIDEMGRVSGEKAAWGSVANDPSRRTYSGIVVLRPDGPLFWANAAAITDRIRHESGEREGLRAVVLDLEATNQFDVTTTGRLTELLRHLRSTGVDLYLVRVFGDVKTVLARAGFLDELGPDHVWHSIAAGVKAAKRAPGLPLPDELDDPDADSDSEDERIVSKAARTEVSAGATRDR